MAGLLPDQDTPQSFGGVLGFLAMLYHSGLLNSFNPIGPAQAAEDPRNSKLGMGPLGEGGPARPGSGGAGGGGLGLGYPAQLPPAANNNTNFDISSVASPADLGFADRQAMRKSLLDFFAANRATPSDATLPVQFLLRPPE